MRAEHPRWDDVKKLFLQAIDLPAAEREELLDRTCGKDAELRSEVASLLASHENDQPFLQGPPIPGAAHAIAVAVEEVEERRAEFEPGRRIGQYEILESLGAGGMGIVYRAHDTRLDRFVALKIVRDRATGVADRVLREARAASALNHPNICTLYEVGEVDGHPFLAMEHIAGHTLSTLIPPDGLRPGDVITYGVQIGRCACARPRAWRDPSRSEGRERPHHPTGLRQGPRFRPGKT
jgi:serine/threonine protein kinase